MSKVCNVTGPKGGQAVAKVNENGTTLYVGKRPIRGAEALAGAVTSRGERRKIRRTLFRRGLRGLSAALSR